MPKDKSKDKADTVDCYEVIFDREQTGEDDFSVLYSGMIRAYSKHARGPVLATINGALRKMQLVSEPANSEAELSHLPPKVRAGVQIKFRQLRIDKDRLVVLLTPEERTALLAMLEDADPELEGWTIERGMIVEEVIARFKAILKTQASRGTVER